MTGGRGRGWRNRYYATGLSCWQRSLPGYSALRAVPTAKKETDVLREEAQLLEQELQGIKKKLEDIESNSKEGA